MLRLNRVLGHLESEPARVFHNARIWTDALNMQRPSEWMVVQGSTVTAVGSGPFPKIVDAKYTDMEGRTILPGIQDAHIHVMMLGKSLFQVNCSGADSIEELQRRLGEFMDTGRSPGDGWVTGRGWDQGTLGRFPSKADLDAIEPTRPVLIWRQCHHVCVLNSAALKLAGVTRDTPDPPGGVIDRDATGEPTGVLREAAAPWDFVKEDREAYKKYAKAGLQRCLEMGVTAVQTNDEKAWKLYCELADADELPIRVFLTVMQSEVGLEGTPPPNSTHGPLLSCHRVKLFTDGCLGAETAAMSSPYLTSPLHRCDDHDPQNDPDKEKRAEQERRGVLIHTPEDLNERVRAAHLAGYRIECHAIGDRAAEVALDAFDYAGLAPVDRPIITHAQILREELVARMARMGVIADVQPQFATTDWQWTEQRLHAKLQRYAYAWKSLIQAGVVCAGGSDSPVEIPDPFVGMHAVMWRPKAIPTLENQQKLEIWRPEERLTQREALHMYTGAAAWTAGVEHKLGKLQAGYLADFVVVDTSKWNNPLEMWQLGESKDKEVYVHGVRKA